MRLDELGPGHLPATGSKAALGFLPTRS
jgi:hypothetical protein